MLRILLTRRARRNEEHEVKLKIPHSSSCSSFLRALRVRENLQTFPVIIGFGLLLIGLPVAVHAQPKLIEFGWGEPNTRYIKENISRMEEMPFDGLVFHARYLAPSGKSLIFSRTIFQPTPITWAQLQPAIYDLTTTRFRRFTDNFLRVNVTPGAPDWFDDFSAVLSNCALAARFSREGGLRGLFFDLEQYGQQIFHYPDQKYSGKSFDEYAKKVRTRGEEVMHAFQTAWPDLTIFLAFGYNQEPTQGKDQHNARYGLLPAFLDGLFAAARGKTTIIDGYEASYSYATPKQFQHAYDTIHKRNKKFSALPTNYTKHIQAAFGIWIDLYSNKKGWDQQNLDNNPNPPARLTAALTTALKRTDRYVWLYSEQPKWWTKEQLPQAYIEAVRVARDAE